MSRGALLRLGLYQLGAGAVSVLFLGVLNRVLRVEMGLDLLTIGIALGGGHYLGALAAIPFGHYSDRQPLFGFHRTPYILIGITAVCVALATAPFVARGLLAREAGVWALPAFLFFLAEGSGTYVAGTAYLALITDRTPEAERGRTVALVWTLLMFGILAGVFYSVATLGEYSFAAISRSFGAAAAAVFVLALIALWRQEPSATSPVQSESVSLGASVRALARDRQARCFFAFLVVGLFATFMQDVVLEPFGGEVLGLSVRATSLFNAYLMVGVIGAMWLGGARLIPIYGKPAVTTLGAWVQAAAFGLLVTSALLGQAGLAPFAILVLGAGMGLFTVGGVTLMMDMTRAGQTGLFVGAWTLAQALAKGPAAVAASGLHSLASALGATPGIAYAVIFVVEAVGLVVAMRLLKEVNLPQFQSRPIPLSTALTQAAE